MIQTGANAKKVATYLLDAIIVMVVLTYILSPRLVERGVPGHATAIVVIGGDHKPERMQEAARLFSQGVAPLVIVSSGTLVNEGGLPVIESALMLDQGERYGIPRSAMIQEIESQTTIENAREISLLCVVMRCESLVVVTSAYQSRRAGLIFREVFGAKTDIVIIGATQPGCPPCYPSDVDQYGVAVYEYRNLLLLWLGLAK